jgi:transposase-like protein
VVSGEGDGSDREVFPPELIGQLTDRAKTGGIGLLGDGGGISKLTKRTFERALTEELTEELGYERCDPVGRGSDNVWVC